MDKLDILQFAAEEADNRAIRYKDVEILPYQPPAGVTDVLCPPGSVTVYLTRPTESTVDQIRRLVTGGGAGEHDELVRQVRGSVEGRASLNYSRAWRLLRRQAVFAELRCGTKTLATNLFLPSDLAVGAISFPYNGGGLPSDTLTLVEHVADDSVDGEGLTAIGLSDPGPLSDAERAALELVPADQAELNISTVADCCPDLTGFSILVLMTLVLAQEKPIENVPMAKLERMSPGASARELMELRREALGHSH